jgi:hypothetical protein
MHRSHARLLILIIIDPIHAPKDCIEAFIKALVPAKATVATAQHAGVVAAELVVEVNLGHALDTNVTRRGGVVFTEVVDNLVITVELTRVAMADHFPDFGVAQWAECFHGR